MELRSALLAYVKMVFGALADAAATTPARTIVGLEEWRRESDGSFRLHDREEPGWASCLVDNLERLHASGEYAEAIAALRADSHIAKQLGVLVGSTLGAVQLAPERVLDGLVHQLAREVKEWRFDEPTFDRVFQLTIERLRAKELVVTAVAPLLGFRSEQLPIQLADSLSISAMTDAEVAACLTSGGIRPFFGQHRRTVPIAPLVAVRGEFRTPKRIGDDLSKDDPVTLWSRATDKVSEVIHALRVFKDERFQAPVIVFRSGWPMEGSSMFQPLGAVGGPFLVPTCTLSSQDAAAFTRFWERLQSPPTRKWVGPAIRRFSYALERHRPDDVMTDLLIAAESLFLSDAGKAEYRGELRFRLALRAALFVQANFSRRGILDFFKRAYDVRSSIVHGGTPDPKRLKSPAGDVLTLSEFSAMTEQLMRSALKKAVDSEEPDDWDAMAVS